MQNQQMAAMAAMNANAGVPVDGTPMMANMPRPGPKDGMQDPRNLINTYIYDYFIRNNHIRLAKSMIDSELMIYSQPAPKTSPGNRNVNGVDDMEDAKDLPVPVLPQAQCVENSFLLDWWLTFWDIFSASRGRGTQKSAQYTQHARSMAELNNNNRTQRLMMNMNNMNPAQYQNMMRQMPNGVGDPNNLKRAAMNNRNNPNGAGPMANMNKQAMMSAQMQRDGSGMDMNGTRPQSPGSTDNAPSPNKRPRIEGGMNPGNMAGNQFEFAQQGQNVQQQKSLEGMNPGVQGSPMNQQGLEGHQDMFAGNPARPGMPPAPGQPQGNHALQDYQMQLMLLEQQNKKRLLMARQEQDSMSAGPHNQPNVGGPGFPPAMSPSGSRAGPSPNPTDQMKRGTPKLGQQGLPGSPMPDASMQGQRGSPAPGMSFDPSQMPPGMPPQFPGYNQMQQNPMMRPPSSHPNFNINGQQLTPQQMEAMRQNGGMPNGAWRGAGPQGMMQGQGQPMGGPMGTPQQRNQMPPPPAPAGEQPRAPEASPSQPAAPPTPSQQNKANPKKKATKDNKKPAKAKGATGATPAASAEEPPTPTPPTPITPMHKNSFGQNGQQQGQPAAQPPQPSAAAPQTTLDNSVTPFGDLPENDFNLLDGFGTSDSLGDFDFDSFLHVSGEDNNFGFGEGFDLGTEQPVEM